LQRGNVITRGERSAGRRDGVLTLVWEEGPKVIRKKNEATVAAGITINHWTGSPSFGRGGKKEIKRVAREGGNIFR